MNFVQEHSTFISESEKTFEKFDSNDIFFQHIDPEQAIPTSRKF